MTRAAAVLAAAGRRVLLIDATGGEITDVDAKENQINNLWDYLNQNGRRARKDLSRNESHIQKLV